jgi:acetyl esterase/lipase
MARIADRLAQAGYVAVSISYRLAPDYKYPAQLHDCKEAVRWMRRNAQQLDIDPDRIGAFGYSSGGHLVSLLATTGPEDGLEGADSVDLDSRVQAAVVGAAPTDLRKFTYNWTFYRFLGGSKEQIPEVYDAASPITFVSEDDPPMFLYHGRTDWIVDVDQSRAMATALDRAGVPAEYFEVETGHFTTFAFDDEPVQRAIHFLDRWLKPKQNAGTAAF